MQLPLQVTFRNMDPSPAIEARIREKAAKLDRFYEHIMSCRVAVEAPHRQHQKGNLFHVRIDVTVPDKELVASREPDLNHAHEDVYVVIRDAFDAIVRQLEDYARLQQNKVKVHEVPPHGRVTELFEEHGTIDSSDGRIVYFHRNSVINYPFEKLSVGMEVQFAEEQGDAGPQASTVKVLEHHHILE